MRSACGRVLDSPEAADFIVVNNEGFPRSEPLLLNSGVITDSSWITQCLINQMVLDHTEYLRDASGNWLHQPSKNKEWQIIKKRTHDVRDVSRARDIVSSKSKSESVKSDIDGLNDSSSEPDHSSDENYVGEERKSQKRARSGSSLRRSRRLTKKR